MSMRQRCWSVS